MENTRFTKLFVIALFTIIIQVISAYAIPESEQGISNVTNSVEEDASSLVVINNIEEIKY